MINTKHQAKEIVLKIAESTHTDEWEEIIFEALQQAEQRGAEKYLPKHVKAKIFRIRELEREVKEAEKRGLLRGAEEVQELLKCGQHEGKCTNEGSEWYENEGCELHWKAAEKRKERAIKWLEAIRKEANEEKEKE